MGLALDIALIFYTSVAKGSKIKVREFCELIPRFVEVTGEKLIMGGGGVGRAKQGLMTRNLSLDSDVRQWSHPLKLH